MRRFDYFIIALVAVGLIYGLSVGLPVKVRKKRAKKKENAVNL